MIKVSDIRKSYGRVDALRGVSLEVKPCELLGIIGPDGAGKSTLMRILTTLVTPDAGEATVDGLDVVRDYRRVRDIVGYMPGRFSLYPDLSVEENINFYTSIFGVSREEGYGLIEPIYKQLEPFRKRRAGKLSGGMKQKLALCCALIHRPKVLVLDEPTTGVDVVSRREFWDLLEQLREQGITIIASTPYMDEATRCRRVALINDGAFLDIDTPQALMRKHGKESVEEVFIELMGAASAPPAPRTQGSGAAPSRPAAAISVNGLTKRFGSFTAVDHITFDVAKGEIFGFLGANGAGKTTAMRMLCGLSFPTEGTGIVAGYDIRHEAEQIKRSIGYMSQRFSLYDDLSVWQNIEFFGGVYGMSPAQIEERGRQLLEELNFYDRRDETVSSIPLGWKQKMAFTIALLHRPQIVFLDEPTGGVDPVVRRQFWDLIRSTAAKGVTIFVTTHYMDEAEYCDRISIMVDGQVSALDTPARLKEQFLASTMEEVFYKLAREGKRQ